MTASTRSATAGRWAGIGNRPGFRTFASPAFRRLIALLLIGAGLLYLAVLLIAVDRAGAFEVDFVHAYRRASLELLAGHSPYFPEQLAAPFPANGRYGWYLYPPAFAQVLTPIAVLPETISAAVWFGLQVGMLFAAAWLPASAAGAPRTVDRAMWTSVAILFFLPVHEVLWTGNMGGPFALGFAVLLVAGLAPANDREPASVSTPASAAVATRSRFAAGALTGALAVFKLSPFAWLPAAVRAGGGLARGAIATLVGLLVVSVLAAPQAWAAYARVLQNLLAGDVRYPNNLAPAIVALNLGAPGPAVDAIRIAALGLAVGLVVASVWFARRPGSWPVAVVSAMLATLLVPAALWYHYLVLLLPLAAFAWVRASVATRVALTIGGLLVSVGMTMPFAAFGGLLVMVLTIVAALRPRETASWATA
jgi:hypothetical protein